MLYRKSGSLFVLQCLPYRVLTGDLTATGGDNSVHRGRPSFWTGTGAGVDEGSSLPDGGRVSAVLSEDLSCDSGTGMLFEESAADDVSLFDGQRTYSAIDSDDSRGWEVQAS